ncbi:MAG TPA: hypothetical protein VJ741_17465 [Solirubrobacteraceae bacterium]|nr:hypothetical protein [Solirubrobacteraceae bacterium]
MIVDRRPELTDDLAVLYCDWRLRCQEVRTTYGRLDSASKEERPLVFAAFQAALDREGSAADAYAEQIRRLAMAA